MNMVATVEYITATVQVDGRTFKARVRVENGCYSVVYDERTYQLRQSGEGVYVEVPGG